ncbi:MAG: 16S rRNA (cytosine(967)-C(5))-methyltransferase RsmB, partial [Clostridia bacterium]|nr:16S rRNA (cytosine(967)-C(5))-methyltransferase RsmB [Clostridia bacterium]
MADAARRAAYTAYRRIVNGAYSNLISFPKELTGLDRAFAETVALGTLERKISLEYAVAPFIKKETDQELLDLILTGLYQVFFMDRVPDSAACDETVKIAKDLFGARRSGFVNAVVRSAVRAKKERLEAIAEAGGHIAASMDKALYDMIKSQYPDKADAICRALFGAANTCLRVNGLVSNAAEVAALTGGRVINEKTVVGADASEAVKHLESGKYFIQGAGSQRAVERLGAQSGETVVDVCACPGGKSLGAALDMNNSGRIYSFDLHANKLPLIEKSAAKLGVTIIETAEHDARSAKTELLGKTDRVICDVPCSGTGEMRAKPEIKYKDPADFEGLYKTQRAILAAAAQYLKPGGKLVYSTCSINKKENEEAVSRFLAANPGFMLLREETMLPCDAEGEGFYTAEIIRENSL